MSEDESDPPPISLLIFLILIAGNVVIAVGDSLESDKQILLTFKSFLEERNLVNRGRYTEWNQSSSPCDWPAISCTGGRVTGIDLSDEEITGDMFPNFSALTALTSLDLSGNTIGGEIPADLGRCRNLKLLNLSHNLIDGGLNLTGMNSLEVLDLSLNRLKGEIHSTFPAICNRLIVVNISTNNFIGGIENCFEECRNLEYLDLSYNNFSGELWAGIARLREFSVSENSLGGTISRSIFPQNCTLQVLDLSENHLIGEVPKEISNCSHLHNLNLWGNEFTGKIPSEFGSMSGLEALYLGNNKFSREIPETLLGLRNLAFLDLSRNYFGGEIQPIFGKFTQVKFLVLHGNSYTGGILSSGILNLTNISRLDLSYNNFTGPLPVEISEMAGLKFLILAYNDFTGHIPSEYGNLLGLQALDLSYNALNGTIPPSLGNLTSLLWLMLANNLLGGEIPAELGNCRSLLWLNLANNQLSGKIPAQLTSIGSNATSTFQLNQKSGRITAGSGECLAMRRWIPADYPPFKFVYTLLTRKTCRSIWDRILKGHGLFPVCVNGSNVRDFRISGYVQLSGNRLSGQIPPQIAKMQNFSMLHLGLNRFSGSLPREIGVMPLVVLNISQNNFSGEIPIEIGNIRCLQNLDLSYNNFSGYFPTSLNNLTELSKFNISYNPYITGVVPDTGQLATFEKNSYFGNPLLQIPFFISNTTKPLTRNNVKAKTETKIDVLLVLLALTFSVVVCGLVSLVVCIVVKSPKDYSPGYLLEETKGHGKFISSLGSGSGSGSCSSSPWISGCVKVIRLDKTAFTHADILKATGNFSDGRIIGRGGSGIVYRGVLPDGREVAVKKIQREGTEGEKEFRAEMEVLNGNGFGWPHPNLVTLYGWCLDGAEKLLVYEYMEGGNLEDLVSDRTRMMMWRRRLDVALDVARALVFLHHECFPSIVHRDVKASNVLLDKNGKARVTDFGLARMVDVGDSHVSTMVAGTVGYVAPEYGQMWHATTKGDVYSYGVLAMELATARRAVDGGDECLVEWARRVMGNGRHGFVPVAVMGSGLVEGAEEMCELLRIGIRCTAEAPQARPNMKEVLAMLVKISYMRQDSYDSFSPPSDSM